MIIPPKRARSITETGSPTKKYKANQVGQVLGESEFSAALPSILHETLHGLTNDLL